jgi:hypothetical protein
MRHIHAVSAIVLLSVVAPAQGQPVPRGTEFIQIDGSKNPELIPQWSSWGFAFRIFSGGPRELPSTVHVVASKDEAAMILREADAMQKVDAACAAKMAEVTKRIGKEKASVLDEEGRKINLDCRWQTLYARDRILERLNPQARVALIAFVESTKKGRQVSVPKNGLARYLEPQ